MRSRMFLLAYILLMCEHTRLRAIALILSMAYSRTRYKCLSTINASVDVDTYSGWLDAPCLYASVPIQLDALTFWTWCCITCVYCGNNSTELMSASVASYMHLRKFFCSVTSRCVSQESIRVSKVQKDSFFCCQCSPPVRHNKNWVRDEQASQR